MHDQDFLKMHKEFSDKGTLHPKLDFAKNLIGKLVTTPKGEVVYRCLSEYSGNKSITTYRISSPLYLETYTYVKEICSNTRLRLADLGDIKRSVIKNKQEEQRKYTKLGTKFAIDTVGKNVKLPNGKQIYKCLKQYTGDKTIFSRSTSDYVVYLEGINNVIIISAKSLVKLAK